MLRNNDIYRITCETISESLDWGACADGENYFYFVDGIIALMEELIKAEEKVPGNIGGNTWEKTKYSC